MHGGAKKLQEAISHGASSSDSTQHRRNRLFQKQTSNDSLIISSESGEERAHGFSINFRSRMSFGSTDEPSLQLRKLFRKQSSLESSESNEVENRKSFGSSFPTKMSISSIDQPSAAGNSSRQRRAFFKSQDSNDSIPSSSHGRQPSPMVYDGPREAMKNGEVSVDHVKRMTSGVSSACSFDTFDDLPIILSEEDEMNELELSRTTTTDDVVGEIETKGDSKKRRKKIVDSSCALQ
jgi:hypothetical protein